MTAQQPAFQKRSDSRAFQITDPHSFSTRLDTSRRLKRKKTPAYRLVNRYFKSTTQYRKQRNRRKKVYELYSQGLTQQQIAEKLGVCARTVSSDLKKTRRYHTGRVNSMLQAVLAERDAEYTRRYETLSLREQRKQLLEDFKFINKILATRRRLQETMYVTIRLEEIMRAARDKNAYGRPFVKLDTRTMTLQLNRFRLKIRFTAGDQRIGEATYTCGDFTTRD